MNFSEENADWNGQYEKRGELTIEDANWGIGERRK